MGGTEWLSPPDPSEWASAAHLATYFLNGLILPGFSETFWLSLSEDLPIKKKNLYAEVV